jgi:hypothetical protein
VAWEGIVVRYRFEGEIYGFGTHAGYRIVIGDCARI